MTLREDYDLPRRTPLPVRIIVAWAAIPILAFAVWLIVPGAVTVAILALALLGAVGYGVYWAASARHVEQAPGRDLHQNRG